MAGKGKAGRGWAGRGAAWQGKARQGFFNQEDYYMNNVQLIGRLGQEPESRQTNGGVTVVNASLAVSKRVKGQDQTTWVRLVFWDKVATIVSNYCKKGDQIAIVGELQTREYIKDNQNRSITEVRVHGLDLLGKGPRQEREPGSDDDKEAFQDDDLPF